MKSRKGFTLVETIVVAVILLVLASIGIPLYSGFVTTARQDAVDNLAETAAAAANTYYRKTGTAPTLAALNLYYDNNTHTITFTNTNVSVVYVKNNSISANRRFLP